ncbi:tetratricopeptide repeat protein [Pontibacter sp. HSC-36F09]|uniref:tetratricopeptide repeat protein n=1 Tax=Pontibacter sp. HSC-36F09 TaxID=2910966 RepID=UPI00209DE0A2|nr:tetratricopeptide repeat protein [Pontibacter sp. HSC-36F09]MCP2044574.1 Tfp pilus assembly protein PilF [Pontibacter sp. HSC-36F09]
MKRIFLAAATIILSASMSFAQEQQPELSPKVRPMFGQVAKTDAEQKADEKFLTSCDKSFESRTEASNFFMERGWEFMNEGQVDTAMYRFNLAWLLNPDNFNTYWAFGVAEYNRGNVSDAIGMFDRALKYQPNNSLLLSDVGSAYLQQYIADKKKKNLKQAAALLDRSLKADPNNAFAMSNLAQVHFHNKKYAEAWDYLHRGRDLNIMSLDYNFLTELMTRMPDPKGMFRLETEAPAPAN